MTAKPTPSQRPLLTLEYQMTLAEIGEEMGITPERVRQIERKALSKLRRELHRRGFEQEDFF